MPGTDSTMKGMKPGFAPFVGALPLLGVLSALSGCTVGPNFTKPEAAIAKEWRTQGDPRLSTQSEVDTQWWKSFGDPSLDRLVEVAYRQNLPLQIAGLRIVEARAQLAILTGRQFPQVQVATGSAAAVGRSENSAGANLVDLANLGSIDRHYLEYQLGFDALWELDFWGKYRRGVESGAASLLGSVADYQSSLVSLTAEVARTYVLVRTFEVLIEQARENVRIQEEGFRIAESRFNNGVTSELDMTQAATLLESTRATIPQLEGGLEQARNALSTLLGQPTGAVEALLAGPKQIPVAPATVAVGMPAEILRRRPDVRSAELYAAAQCARIGIAESELYPSFSLFGTVGLQASTSGAASGNLFSLGSLAYSIGPRIVFPFLNYGRLKNGVRVEDARFQQLLVNYRNTVLKAGQEVADALTGFVNAQKAMAFQQAAVKAAQRSVELAVVQYREGAVDYQRVLDAQRSLLEQQNNLAQTSSSIATNLVALYKALGGGWEVRKSQPVVPEPMQSEMEQRTHWGDMLSKPRSQEAKTLSQPGKQ
ncbi:efflux transporter outer membrane subunit [Corallococcus carmarthensis]|uniref:Efflux transporter outer membrane subunit n=2 Tax=Corallococcus carmarthensis TaxID=2316728 RepID=A0A3A8KI98_9BACT|nr:efflux transporter outer membrane subunit [Corallococcus carmarthensis]RKH07680.1 efflux transporter outer membrane subunit [Corallococcus carmarthensis]